MSHSPVTTQVAQLADLARRTLARPGEASLHVEGLAPDGGLDGVDLIERDGMPVLLCPAQAAVVTAARGARSATLVLAVDDQDDRHLGMTVRIRGRLSWCGEDVVERTPVTLVRLTVTTVTVHQIGPHGSREYVVPLERYLAADGRSFDQQVAPLIEHVNADHASEVVALVARTLGRDPAGIAAAWIAALDPDGADIGWIDRTGARVAELCFPETARCLHEIADLLRGELRGGQLLL